MQKPFTLYPSRETKTKQNIADEMKISLRTLQRRLTKVGLKIPRGHIPPDVQDTIYEALGWRYLARNGAR